MTKTIYARRHENKPKGEKQTMNMNKLMAVTAVCVAVVFLPAYADTVEWNGEAGNGSLSDGGNWVGGVAPVAGDALDFSSIASATTLNADFGDGRTFGAVTMGNGVITFTGAFAVASFSNYANVAVGANSTVTINNNLSFAAGQPLCNTIAAGGKLHLKGSLTLTHGTAADFLFAKSNCDGAVVAEGGITIAGKGWTVMNTRALVLGLKGISFSKDVPLIFTNNGTVYSLGATTVLGTAGMGSYCGSTPLTICTTQFESDQPATITFAGNFTGRRNYWAAGVVTGCGKVVFPSTSSSNRGITVTDGSTLAMTPGVNMTGAGGETLAVNSGATLEVAAAGTVGTSGKLTFAAGSTLDIAACSAGYAVLSVSQTLTLPSSGTVNLTLNGGAFTPGVYVILANSGVTAAMGEKFSFSTGGEPAAWSVVGNRLVLTVGSVPANRWTGAAGDGKMSNGANWGGGVAPSGGSALDFSAVAIATTVNADIADAAFDVLTMGSGVITFTGALTASAFSDYSRIAVGANSSVTIDNSLSFTGNNKILCNAVAAGGKLRVTGSLTIAHASGDFYFTQNNSAGAVSVDGRITLNSPGWVVLSAKALAVGEDGIAFSRENCRLCVFNNASLYPLCATASMGTAGLNAYSVNNGSTFTICTTQFESDQPATITFSGRIGGVRNYWNGVAVTGCGRVVFTSDSYTDRALTVNDGATLAMTPGCSTTSAVDQTFTVNSGATLEVPASGTTTLGFNKTIINSGATLAFNFTDRMAAPVLALGSNGTSSLPGTVDVKVSASVGVAPKVGKYALTSGMDFTGKTVNLIDKPKWARGVSVDENGNLMLTVISNGLVILVK